MNFGERMVAVSSEIAERFTERFPRYTFLLPQWMEEAAHVNLNSNKYTLLKPQKLSIPEQTELLYCYGIGDEVFFPFIQSWLKGDSRRRLVLLEPDPTRIVHVLQQSFTREIVESTQIEIVYLPSGRSQNQVLSELAERYPLRGVYFLSYSANQRQFHRVKTNLLRKTALTHAHYVERLHGHIPFTHLVKNLKRIPKAFYANRLKGAFANIPAILCGAGPSLAHSIEELRKMEDRALIFAGGSALAVLSHHGITPHFGIAIDPNSEEFQRLKNSFAFEVPFLFSSRLIPEGFMTCNGPFGYLRSGMAGIAELWFEEQLGCTEQILGEYLSSEALSVTALSAAFAYHLGCNPILFDGLDLAYTANRRYAEGVFADEEDKEDRQPIDRLVMKRDHQGKSIKSAVRWVMEARALSRLAKRCKDRCWINSTQGGLEIKGIKKEPLAKVAHLFSQERDLRALVHVAIQGASFKKDVEQILEEKKKELTQSLQAVIAHLDQLISKTNAGLCALAELELQDELATSILLYDLDKTLRVALPHSDPSAYWIGLKEVALRYLDALRIVD